MGIRTQPLCLHRYVREHFDIGVVEVVHLLFSAGVVVRCTLVEGPLAVCVVIAPLTEVVPKVKTPKQTNKHIAAQSKTTIKERENRHYIWII